MTLLATILLNVLCGLGLLVLVVSGLVMVLTVRREEARLQASLRGGEEAGNLTACVPPPSIPPRHFTQLPHHGRHIRRTD